MFEVNDIPKFLLAFFLVMPVISFLHEGGHVFFAWLMGGKNIKVTIGTGKVISRIGLLEIRQYYFWYGLCTFENLKRNERFSNILIFSGGVLFNILGMVAVIALAEHELIETGMLTYQFTYFSMYYVVFALLPMPYPDGNYSDGKVILDLIRNRNAIIAHRTYRLQWNGDEEQWYVLDHNQEIVDIFDHEKEALETARKIAQNNRPSRIVNSKNGEEKEVQNYPRIPL